MSVENVSYKRNLSANTSQGPSESIWANCPINDLLETPGRGLYQHFEFLDFPPHASTSGAAVSGALGQFSAYLYQGGAIADSAEVGGVLDFSADGDNEGAAIGPYTAGARISSSYGPLWFECRIKSSTITDTKHGIFCGLIEPNAIAAAVPLTTGDAWADKNMVGFWRREADGDQIDFGYKADGQTAVYPLTDMISGGLVADTYVKLGFFYDFYEVDSAKRLKVFVNGVEQTTYVSATTIATTAFPNDIFLGCAFAVMNATGTTPGSSSIDWMRLAQLYP